MAEGHILQIKSEGKVALNTGEQIHGKRMTLFRHLANSDMPESELSVPRLVNEAQVLLGAGTVGTARALDLTCYYILASPQVKAQLAGDLKETMKDWPTRKPTWAQLEKIPYLQAVIKEGLR
jgi:cytochrome P450